MGVVISLESERSTLWIGTSVGLFKWDNTHTGLPAPINVDTGTVYVLKLDGDSLWIGSERGLFRWDKPTQGLPQRIDITTGPVSKLYKCGTKLLISGNGLFLWQDVRVGRPTRLNLDVHPVNVFHPDGAILWIGSEKGLLRWDCKRDEAPVFMWQFKGMNVTSLAHDSNSLLIGTNKTLFSWNRLGMSEPEQVPVDSPIYNLYKEDDSPLLISAAGKGLLRWDNIRGGQPRLVDSTIVRISKYSRNGSILWMGAGLGDSAGLFRWDRQKEDSPPRVASLNTGFVHDLHINDDTLWVGADKGLFRVEGLGTPWVANIRITSDLPKVIYTDHNLLIQWQVGDFGGRITPDQVRYQVIVKDAGGREVEPGEFKVQGKRDFTLPRLNKGDYTLYIQATDLNGHTDSSQPVQFTVYSLWQDPFCWLKLGGTIYLVLILFAIVLAPFSDFWHGLLMNPWLRTVGSLGLIPIALTIFPPVRRHILKRYFGGVRDDEEFSAWQTRFVIPTEGFFPNTFGTVLTEKRKLLLQGVAGIGKTSYLKYLTGYYVRQKKTPPLGIVPVLFPLVRYQGELPENIFTAQLARYGQLTDEKLNNWFLQSGGFLIFIDGLNEVDESMRQKISAFVDRYSNANYFCISSQHSYPEFADIERVQLAALSEDKIKEFLQKRLGEEQAQAILKEFGENIAEIYNIPHDLEFAIEFKESNPAFPIPRSKMELYEATLAPMLNGWVEEGRTDYSALLFQRAYVMLCTGDAYFDNSEVPLPDDLRDGLVEKKFLIPRSTHYLFRHDLVRSFLASKYFTSRWQELLSDEELKIDDNWRTMLEFVLLNLRRDEVRDVLERTLITNKRLAGELFSWLEVTNPSICSEWATDFKIKFADAMLIGT
jgi:hypothetical protein